MALEDFFGEYLNTKSALERIAQQNDGPYGDPYPEIGTIAAVDDPKKLGRVKVIYADGTESDWVYVRGQGRGIISSQYIGGKALIVKSDGNSEDAFIVGIFNTDEQVGVIGEPIQITVLDEQARIASKDPGTKCNEGNLGRVFIGSNEIHQDFKICIRRTNNQETGEEAQYMWKSLTHGEMIEKGFDPGAESEKAIKDLNKGKNRGVPECTPALAGEIREFAEDRAFRRTLMICRRTENKDEWDWIPVSAPPTFLKTTLPDCTEKVHGMEAVVDDGNNSELVVCMRYQGSMKWVKPGKRDPLQFYKKDPPLSKIDFLDSAGIIPALQTASPAAASFLGVGGPSLNTNVLDGMLQKVNPFNAASSPLGLVNTLANALPGTFNGADTLSNIAKTVIANNTNLSSEAVIGAITSAVAQGGVIGSDLESILNTLGGAAQPLIAGAQNGNVGPALEQLGKSMLRETLSTIDPSLGSVFSGYMAGGAQGAIDSALMVGLNQLPTEIGKYVGPLASLGSSAINGQPIATQNIINAAIGVGTSGLQDVFGDVLSIGSSGGIISPATLGNIASSVANGDFGELVSGIGSFANIDALPKMLDGSSIPKLATTALGVLGQGGSFASLLGGGIGLGPAGAVLGAAPVAAVLSGVPGIGGAFGGLGGLFGGGGGAACPCDPKCRKTEHGVDSDGNRLLDPCGSVVSNNANSYMGGGSDPTNNNNNPVAEDRGKENSGLGEPLLAESFIDLTQLISNVSRIGEMADKLEQAAEADFPELFQELMYTFEGIEKGFKQTDNNITRVESIERKLIDALYRILKRFLENGGRGGFGDGILIQLIRDVREQAKAIKDLYKFTQKLDAVKNGGPAGVNLTDNIAAAIQNIADLQLLISLSKKEALEILNGLVRPADREWRTLESGYDSVNLDNFILGNFNPNIESYFDLEREGTKRNRDYILNQSLSSKINSPLPPQPNTFIENQLSSPQLSLARNTPANNRRVTQSLPGALIENQLSSTESTLTNNDIVTQSLPGAFIENQLSPAESTLTNNNRATQSLLDEIKFENTRSVEKRTDC